MRWGGKWSHVEVGWKWSHVEVGGKWSHVDVQWEMESCRGGMGNGVM